MQQSNIVLTTTNNNLPAPATVTHEDEIAFLAYKLRIAEKRINDQEVRIRELENLAATDPMTGLLNRRGFEKLFAQELSRTRRYNTAGGILMLLDLNDFKLINDTYGHQAGDACLKKVADYLKARLRPIDGAARLGGDEFAVFLSQTDTIEAAEEIKATLKNLFIVWEGQKIPFSLSAGFTRVNANNSYDNACQNADRELYADKSLKNISPN